MSSEQIVVSRQVTPGAAAVPCSDVAVAPLATRGHGAVAPVIVGVLSLLVWLGLWELASRLELSFFFRFENIPAPSEVIKAAGDVFGAPKFLEHVSNSIRRVFVG